MYYYITSATLHSRMALDVMTSKPDYITFRGFDVIDWGISLCLGHVLSLISGSFTINNWSFTLKFNAKITLLKLFYKFLL